MAKRISHSLLLAIVVAGTCLVSCTAKPRQILGLHSEVDWRPDTVATSFSRVVPGRVAVPDNYSIFGITVAWDGSFFIKSNLYWTVQAFRPGLLKQTKQGRPDFSKAFSDALPMQYLGTTVTHASQIDMPGSWGNIATAKDESLPLNPYPSDAQGASLADGAFLTYQFLIFTHACGTLTPGGLPLSGEFTCTEGRARILGVEKARVVIAEAGTDRAVAVNANVFSGFTPLLTGSNRMPIAGIEPSVTADGKLLVFHGHPRNNGFIGNVMYAWNAAQGEVAGWSTPKTIHRIHADRNVLVRGTPFGQRYPLALQPFRDSAGKVFDYSTDCFPGAYPWVSPDGTEVFFTATVDAFFGVRRASYSVLGRMTGNQLRNIDGPINYNRYGALFDDGQTSPVIFASPGSFGSRWDPNLSWKTPYLPYLGKAPSYPMFGSDSENYAEVSFEDHEDPSRVLFLHMNELLTQKASRDLPFEFGIDPTRTADTSGNANTATLHSDAYFPQEYPDEGKDTYLGFDPSRGIVPKNRNYPPYLNCVSDNVRGNPLNLCIPGRDVPVGVHGQGIYFGDSGFLKVDPSPSLQGTARSFTAGIFAKRLRDIGVSRSLIYKIDSFQLVVDERGVPKARIYIEGQRYETSNSKISVSVGDWAHLAMTFDSLAGRLSLFVDGELIAERATPKAPIDMTERPLILGPAIDKSTMGRRAYLILDEANISNIAKSQAEIRNEAFLLPIQSRATSVSQKLDLPEGLNGDQVALINASAMTPKIVALGQELFFDPMLSKSRDKSCATCHDPKTAFAIPSSNAVEVAGSTVIRNPSALINRVFSKAQMWDGRSESLEAQVWLPVASVHELNSSPKEVVARLSASPEYVSKFFAAFGGGPDQIRVAAAIAAFEKTILSGGSAYDRAVAGGQPLSAGARRGQNLFFGKAMCVSCHRGPNFSDEALHNTGLLPSTDPGAGGSRNRTEFFGAFKTPTLRNVAQTAPYLHDGSIADLATVVRQYNAGGVAGIVNKDREIFPLGLTEAEISDVVEFLKALTGEVTFGVRNLK